jgi:heme/copper-type cytochrome/quinol oxidase subunit 1
VRGGIAAALVFMVAGIGLGVVFALDPAAGARLRTTHVVANLFGFAGLLISGFGYRYVPQLADVPDMRWPALRMPQVALMSLACAVGMVFMGLRMYGRLEPGFVLWPCLAGATAMALFAINTAATFANSPRR